MSAPLAESTGLLREAAEWRLLSLLLSCPGGPWREQVLQLGEAVVEPGLRGTAEKALEEAGEGLYHSAFGPGGPAAPREVSYSDSVQLGYLISELQAYYEAFGYRPVTEEAIDHISVEAGFVSFLLLKQAFAEESGDTEGAAITAEARTTFLRDHLAWVAEPLAERLEASAIEYLARSGRWLRERVGTSPERRALPGDVLPVIPAEGEFCCGGE